MRAQSFVSKVALALSFAGGVAVVACSQNPPPQQPGATSMQTVDGPSAAERIAAARCKHASACNEIGGSRNYASNEACMSKNRGDAENDLRPSECPHGVNAARLDNCLASINAEACSGIASGWNRGMACRTGQLCP